MRVQYTSMATSNTNLLQTEFAVRTVSYGLSFSARIYGPSASAINPSGKTRIRDLQYGPRKLG